MPEQTEPPAAPERPASRGRGSSRKPGHTRQTVDLPDAVHRQFATWRMESAVQLERTEAVSVQDALAALVHLALHDDAVARRVRDHLERPRT